LVVIDKFMNNPIKGTKVFDSSKRFKDDGIGYLTGRKTTVGNHEMWQVEFKDVKDFNGKFDSRFGWRPKNALQIME